MKKISLKNGGNALSRSEMRNISGGSDPWTIDPGVGTCKLACEVATSNSQCCSGVTATNYTPCNKPGQRVCI